MIKSFYVYFYFFSLSKRKEILCKSQQKNLARQIVMYLEVKVPNNFYANSEIELNFQDHIYVFSHPLSRQNVVVQVEEEGVEVGKHNVVVVEV